MRLHVWAVTAVCAASTASTAPAASRLTIPEDFPDFLVPGYEQSMSSLRELYYLHYQPASPLATLWDEWITGPTLWPAMTTGDRMNQLRRQWSDTLSRRHIDPEGYVATHQHPSIAHQHGWPFPFWAQGTGTWGWHFSLQHVPRGWHHTKEKTQDGWEVIGGNDKGITDHAWNLELSRPRAAIRTPELSIDPQQSPFIQLRWRAENLGNARPYLEWSTEDAPEFTPERRMYFSPPTKQDGFEYTMIPVFRSPLWKGKIRQLGIHFDNPPGATASIQALFTQYDTRHNINNPCYIRGCCQYFWWTRDLNFLRDNLPRMRLALAYAMDSLGGRAEKCIVAPYVGHDGRPGIVWHGNGEEDRKKELEPGRGIGNNYWDLLPMGYQDAYASVHYYDTLTDMARLEREIDEHPEWNLPAGPLRVAPDELLAHAEEVRAYGNEAFWNKETGRYVCGLDADGKFYDYGHTFMNCEAIYYDFATLEQAQSILQWLNGERIVEGDTSTGEDIYHWRFGPRSSTKRNIEWYGWYWSSPEKIPWGDQVQDGGAVLGFSYHDLMSRLKIRGPDDAWARLQEIATWFDEVQEAGGYREYYKDGTHGKLQGGGTPGGLGLDREFYESILVPQIMIDGFLGFVPCGDGFEIDPRLPRDWPELTVTRIALHDNVLRITARDRAITIIGEGPRSQEMIYPPVGDWDFRLFASDGSPLTRQAITISERGIGIPVGLGAGMMVKLTRK